jgi:hypothetical protein
MAIIPKENGRYLVAIAWWKDDVMATYRNGKFIPDGYENDHRMRFTLDHLVILEELPEHGTHQRD